MEHMGVPPLSLVISAIWIQLVRVIKTQNLSLEGSWFLKLLGDSSMFVLIFEKIFKIAFLKSVFHTHVSPHPHPCTWVKSFQIIFYELESRIYYDFEKWRAFTLTWLTCLHGWCASVGGVLGWSVSMGDMSGVPAWVKWVV